MCVIFHSASHAYKGIRNAGVVKKCGNEPKRRPRIERGPSYNTKVSPKEPVNQLTERFQSLDIEQCGNDPGKRRRWTPYPTSTDYGRREDMKVKSFSHLRDDYPQEVMVTTLQEYLILRKTSPWGQCPRVRFPELVYNTDTTAEVSTKEPVNQLTESFQSLDIDSME